MGNSPPYPHKYDLGLDAVDEAMTPCSPQKEAHSEESTVNAMAGQAAPRRSPQGCMGNSEACCSHHRSLARFGWSRAGGGDREHWALVGSWGHEHSGVGN
jgi:hypothetical protein